MKKLLIAALTFGCAYAVWRSVERSQFEAAMQVAKTRYFLVAVPVLCAGYLARALRWYYLFPDEARRKRFRHLFGVMMIGYFGNNLAIARGGEIARIVLMGRYNRIPKVGVLSTIVSERTFDGALLALIGVSALFHLQPAHVPWIGYAGLLFAASFLSLLLLGFQRARVGRLLTGMSRIFPGHLPQFVTAKLQCMLDHLESVATLRGLLRIGGLSAGIWALEAIVYGLIAHGFGVPLTGSQLGLFMAATNFASLAPTPGGLGAIEIAATETMVFSGVPREVALAMVVTQHGLQYGVTLAFGLYYAGRLGFSFRRGLAARVHTLLDIEGIGKSEDRSLIKSFRAPETNNDPYVSMVIPAYNEEGRLLPTLLSALNYFRRTAMSHEIIVVDDGSQDETAQLVRELSRRCPSLRLIRLPRNLGKGAAVRTGVLNASGQFIIFNDADGATPIGEIERLLAAMNEADVAIGSRALRAADTTVHRKLTRAIVGRTFAFLVNAWVVPGIADTQCGFKMFRRDVAQRIFELQRLDGFAFDVEALRLAVVLGYRIAEVPVNWRHVHGSKVKVYRDAVRMLVDIIRVRYLVPATARVSSDTRVAASTQSG